MRGGALILAAGYSKRFGSDKRCYEVAPGESLLTTTLKLYLDTVLETAVILRKEDRQLAAHIQQTFNDSIAPDLLFSPNSHRGMGHSIADALDQVNCWEYVILALGDMPYILPDTIRSIEQELQKARATNCQKIVRPIYKGQRAGHPVGFTCELFAELKALEGDFGAQRVIERHPGSLILLDSEDDGILWDLDTKPA